MSNNSVITPRWLTNTFSFTVNNKNTTIYATQATVEADSYSVLKIAGGVNAEGIIVKNIGILTVKCTLDSTGDFFKNATDEFVIRPNEIALYKFKDGLIPSFERIPSDDTFNLTLLLKIKLNESPVTSVSEPSVNSNFISNNQK